MRSLQIASLIISSYCVLSVVHADNYNYASVGECRAAMKKYTAMAEQLEHEADQQGNTEASLLWFKTNFFIERIGVSYSPYTESCKNGQCVMTIGGDCALVSDKTKHVWATLIVPILENQVNHMMSKIPDPTIINKSLIKVTCTYPQGSVSYNNCTAST